MLKLAKTTSIALVSVSFLFAGTANASVENALQNICAIVKADDKGELRKKMKKVQSDYRLKLRDYYNGVTCGGQSLIRTAILNDAVEAGELLVKKMPKSALGAPESDGKTLQAWISEQGKEGSPIHAVLMDRI